MTDSFADILSLGRMSRALRAIGPRLGDASVRAGAYIAGCVSPEDIARFDSRAWKTERLRRQYGVPPVDLT